MNLLWNVRVAIEHKAGSVRVSTHVLKHEPVSHFGTAQQGRVLLTDLIKSVAGWPKHSCRNQITAVVFFIERGGKSHGLRENVVVNHIVEGAVDAVVHVEGLRLASTALASVDLGGDGGGAVDEVAAWLCDESKLSCFICKLRFKIFDGSTNSLCNLGESWRVLSVASRVVTWESATDVNHVHLVHAQFVCSLKYCCRVIKGLFVCTFVAAARTDMETDTDDVDIKALRYFKQMAVLVHARSELVRKATSGLLIVGGDAKEQLKLALLWQGFVNFSQFVELILAVEDCAGHAVCRSELNVALHFLRVSVNDLVISARVCEAELIAEAVKYHVKFSLSGTVEAAAQGGEQTHNGGVGVAFDSVEGLNHGQMLVPLVELLHDRGKVCDKEGVFVHLVLDLSVDEAGD